MAFPLIQGKAEIPQAEFLIITGKGKLTFGRLYGKFKIAFLEFKESSFDLSEVFTGSVNRRYFID